LSFELTAARPLFGSKPPPFMRHLSDDVLDGLTPDEVAAVVAYVDEERPDLGVRMATATTEFELEFAKISLVGWWNMTVGHHAVAALYSLPEEERDAWRDQPITRENQRRIAARAAVCRFSHRHPVVMPRTVRRVAPRGGRRNVRSGPRRARAPTSDDSDPDLARQQELAAELGMGHMSQLVPDELQRLAKGWQS
jgi:hypothetical protein